MPRPTCYAPLEIRTASAGPSSEYYALSTRNLGNFYHSIGYFAESEKYFRLARSAIEKSEGRNSTELWRITVFEAMLKLDQGQLAVAEDKFKSAVDFFQTRYRDDHHLAFRAFRGYASLLSRTGRSDEATKLSQRSYELSSSQFGQKHFDSIDAALFHADILSRGGDLDAAEALLRTTQLNAQGLHVHARTTLMLCNVLIQNGKASESIQQLDRLIGAGGEGHSHRA
jgi:tetratricopeptide (TPR) repeat protein